MFPFVVATIATMLSAAGVNAATLHQRAIPVSPLVIGRPIIGRATCGESTWLLTDASALIEVNVPKLLMSAAAIHGFTSDEHPWGLACIQPGELWTLLHYRTLARFATSGIVTSRTPLRKPWLNVFAAGERLLLQQPPEVVGGPLLMAARVGDVHRPEPWPSPTALSSSLGKVDVASGLVTCGIGDERFLPCWIRNQTHIAISDGDPRHTFEVQGQFIADSAVDPTVPIWDAALGPQGVLWVLTSASSGVDGRRVGGRITRSNWKGERLGSIDVMPRARLIVSATSQHVTLLTTAGTLVEVGTR